MLVTVETTQGSAPREAGAWMVVFADDVAGSIGGGHLEFQAIARGPAPPGRRRGRAGACQYALGPSLGQCCGGVVRLRFERWAPPMPPRCVAPVARARLRWRCSAAAMWARRWSARWRRCRSRVTWIDSRDEIFPPQLARQRRLRTLRSGAGAVPDLAPGSRVLIMSFSHAEDLDIVAACLRRQRERGDLPYIGLIGSKTKWATFRHRLRGARLHARTNWRR